jgi:long-chain fatty acid transport protein
MGGVGIGMPFGADNGLSNPALISSVENYEVSFGGTIFMPDVSTDGGAESLGLPFDSQSSDADMFIVPEVGFAMKATDNFYWGVGMWGASGLGVDYRGTMADNQLTSDLFTNYQILQLIAPLTYKTGGLSLSVAPVLNYGALDSDWYGQACSSAYPNSGQHCAAGVSQDLNWGANLGAAYQTGGLTLGAVYKSSIKMEYKGQPALNPDVLQNFGIMDVTADRLDVPAEYGIGASYVIGGKHTIAADVKNIAYGSAKGWEDFGWDDQTVIALGYEYNAGKWALRAGYNYGKAPIENLDVFTDPMNGNAGRNYFNAVGFPATVEQHLTFGGTWNFNKTLGLDLAFTYAPEEDTEYDSFFDLDGDPLTPPSAGVVKTSHSQTAFTAGLTFKF